MLILIMPPVSISKSVWISYNVILEWFGDCTMKIKERRLSVVVLGMILDDLEPRWRFHNAS